MEWCRICGSRDLETVEWLEVPLWGDEPTRAVSVLCLRCGAAERRDTNSVPVPG